MSNRADFALRSYIKTTLACLGLVLFTLPAILVGLNWLPANVATIEVAFSVITGLVTATFLCAGMVVLSRHKRALLGKADLFLNLNRSRRPDSIKAGVVPRATRLRRWSARRALGHDFLVGDVVEVKTWHEILATLDERGCLEELPFMPEMRAMCGRRARVFRCMHRLFDYRKTRRMRHLEHSVLLVGSVCDGSSHGGCEAACHTIWKTAWLRRVEPVAEGEAVPATSIAREANDIAVLQHGTSGPRFACQLTQLHAASQVNKARSIIDFLRPLISGNVAPAAFVVGWLTHLFNELQQLRGGVEFPVFEVTEHDVHTEREPPFKAGDRAVVKSSAEIRATLTDRLSHRGLWFEPDMLKHCGRRCVVQAEVRKLIDIVSGEIRIMKTPAYTLRDVHFSGERQLFNSQYEPLFWRAVWLQRDDVDAEMQASTSRPHDGYVD